MPKTRVPFNPDEYATVAERIDLFYDAYPNGLIHTRLVSYEGGRAIVEASVYRRETDPRPGATGLASEHEKDGEINAVACLENTETSAIGRALANLGFSGSLKRPSREEMEKAQRAREALGRSRELTAAFPATPSKESPQGDDRTRRVAEHPTVYDEKLQQRANTQVLVANLLARARRAGFPALRADQLEREIEAARGEDLLLAPLATELRQWLRAYAAALTQTLQRSPMS